MQAVAYADHEAVGVQPAAQPRQGPGRDGGEHSAETGIDHRESGLRILVLGAVIAATRTEQGKRPSLPADPLKAVERSGGVAKRRQGSHRSVPADRDRLESA